MNQAIHIVLAATLALLTARVSSTAVSPQLLDSPCGLLKGVFYALNSHKLVPFTPTKPIDVPENAALVVHICNLHNGKVTPPGPGEVLIPTLVGRVGRNAQVSFRVENVANIKFPGMAVFLPSRSSLIGSLVAGPLLPGASVSVDMRKVGNVRAASLELGSSATLVASIIDERTLCASDVIVSIRMNKVANVETTGAVRLSGSASLRDVYFRFMCAQDALVIIAMANVANIRAGTVELSNRATLDAGPLEVTGAIRASTLLMSARQIAEINAKTLLLTNGSRLRGRSAFPIREIDGSSFQIAMRDVANVRAEHVRVERGSLLSDVILGAQNLVGGPTKVNVNGDHIANVVSTGEVSLSRFSGLGPLGAFFLELNATADVKIIFHRIANVRAASLSISDQSELATRGLAIFLTGPKHRVGYRIVVDDVCNARVNGPVRIEKTSRLMRTLFAVGSTIAHGNDLLIKASRFANIRYARSSSAFIDSDSILVETIFDKNSTLNVQARSVKIKLTDAANVDVPLSGNEALIRIEDLFKGNNAASGVKLTVSSIGQTKRS